MNTNTIITNVVVGLTCMGATGLFGSIVYLHRSVWKLKRDMNCAFSKIRALEEEKNDTE